MLVSRPCYGLCLCKHACSLSLSPPNCKGSTQRHLHRSSPSFFSRCCDLLSSWRVESRTMILVSFLWLTLLLPAFVAAEDFGSYNILPSISDVRKLKVGQELFAEQLALNRGRRIYVLEGLELPKSYEVKISYPASIPASFTIKLLKEGFFQATRGGRRLLNTEKLMFRADESQHAEVYDDIPSAHVLVTVQPAGVVAMPHTKDHAFVAFNILCEEVKFGIPRQAWWIGVLGAVAVLISVVAPMLLPRHLLPRKAKIHIEN